MLSKQILVSPLVELLNSIEDDQDDLAEISRFLRGGDRPVHHLKQIFIYQSHLTSITSSQLLLWRSPIAGTQSQVQKVGSSTGSISQP